MTKKDYELIAGALRYCKPSKVAKPKGYEDRLDCWLSVVDTIANALQSENSKFQRLRFLEACGL